MLPIYWNEQEKKYKIQMAIMRCIWKLNQQPNGRYEMDRMPCQKGFIVIYTYIEIVVHAQIKIKAFHPQNFGRR